jgi:hypothetical protein
MKGKCEDCKQVKDDIIIALIDNKTFERLILCGLTWSLIPLILPISHCRLS